VIAEDERIVHSISVTTRAPRETEVDGVHYHFMTVEEFKAAEDNDAFLEWAEVHGNFYGTLHSEIEKHIASGEDVVLELDVQGMRQVKAERRDVKTIFIVPPSLEVLEQRLRDRGGLTESELKTRLLNAKVEIGAQVEYDYVIVNDKLDDAIARFNEIVKELR
jgi:guanylate kinase